MEKATVAYTKNNLSAMLAQVRRGKSFLILDRRFSVAMLVPVRQAQEPAADRLARLQRGGAVRLAEKAMSKQLLSEAPPKPTGGGDILETLLEEREGSR